MLPRSHGECGCAKLFRNSLTWDQILMSVAAAKGSEMARHAHIAGNTDV